MGSQHSQIGLNQIDGQNPQAQQARQTQRQTYEVEDKNDQRKRLTESSNDSLNFNPNMINQS